MRNTIIDLRWCLVRVLLRAARLAAPKGCDHGDRVEAAVDGFFFYTKNGYMP